MFCQFMKFWIRSESNSTFIVSIEWVGGETGTLSAVNVEPR